MKLFAHIYYKIYLHNKYVAFYTGMFCLVRNQIYKFSGIKNHRLSTLDKKFWRKRTCY